MQWSRSVAPSLQPQSLSSSDLREQIVFQRTIVTGKDEYGHDIVEHANLLVARAFVYAMRGLELERAMQRWAEAKFAARMHYNVLTWQPNRADRVLWGSRVLDLLDIEDPYGNRQWCLAYFREFVQ